MPNNLICIQCGREYQVNYSISRNRLPKKKYCSRTCASKAAIAERWKHHKPVLITCLQCGKQFSVRPSQTNRKFCSVRCARNYPPNKQKAILNLPRDMRGANHPRWKGGHPYGPDWKRNAMLALERDNYTCVRCGASLRRSKRNVHHVIPWRVSKDNCLTNLVSLCVSCHQLLEKELTAAYWELTRKFLVLTPF